MQRLLKRFRSKDDFPFPGISEILECDSVSRSTAIINYLCLSSALKIK